MNDGLWLKVLIVSSRGGRSFAGGNR